MTLIDDYLFFVDEALDGMVEIVTGLGDELANRQPDLPGANSPFATLTHCLGVIEHWAGSVIAGRVVSRDRDGELRAVGAVSGLVERLPQVRRQLEIDITGVDLGASPLGPVDPEDAALPLGRTNGGVLLHVLEELAQHRGQMELSRDLLLAS